MRGTLLLFVVLVIGCGGSSMRNDSIEGAIGGESGTSTSGGGSAGTSNPTPSCVPQDAQFLGTCMPGPKYVYTGVACVGMSGCSCVGRNCDELVPLPPVDPSNPMPNPCEKTFGGCLGISRSCDEIRAVYAEYVSRNECAIDYDCVVNPGGCAVGLGGCYHVMNQQWPSTGLEALIAEWQAAGCSGAVCRCTAPPANAVCVDGVCVAPL